MSNTQLIPPRFLFHFSVPIAPLKMPWTDVGIMLGEEHKLTSLSELDGARTFADVRAGWSKDGVAFRIEVTGKRQAPWCRDTRMEESDGVQLWIDTRNTQTVHRATKYCHRFVFLPGGAGRAFDRPVADQLLINRARENARPVRPRELGIYNKMLPNGYSLSIWVPAAALGGFDTFEYRQLGFQYSIIDRELGVQTFSAGIGLPYEEDPSLWATLDMKD